jgi:hypothetical protein
MDLDPKRIPVSAEELAQGLQDTEEQFGRTSPSSKHTVGSMITNSYKEFASKPFRSRAIASGIIGGLYGLTMHHHDSVIGAVLDTGMSAGVAIGAESATNYIIKNHSQQIKDFLAPKGVSVNHLAQIEGEQATDAMVEKGLRVAKGFGVAGKAVAALIGVGTVLEVGNKVHHARKVDQERVRQEKKLEKQQRGDDRTMRDLFGYQTSNSFGQVVLDMWDDRIGHHKMGNSKFR